MIRVVSAIAMLAAVCGCQTTVGESGATPSAATGPTVSSLVLAQFEAKGWGNGGWSSARQAKHKCPEELWFYEQIGAARSAADLDAFSSRTGITQSRTLTAARMALKGEAIPSGLRHKAQCLTAESIGDLRS